MNTMLIPTDATEVASVLRIGYGKLYGGPSRDWAEDLCDYAARKLSGFPQQVAQSVAKYRKCSDKQADIIARAMVAERIMVNCGLRIALANKCEEVTI